MASRRSLTKYCELASRLPPSLWPEAVITFDIYFINCNKDITINTVSCFVLELPYVVVLSLPYVLGMVSFDQQL